MTDRRALDAALGNKMPAKPRATGDPGGWKRCTDACIKVEAKEARGCICLWGCFKKSRAAKTKHTRMALDPRCIVHSKWAFKKQEEQRE